MEAEGGVVTSKGFKNRQQKKIKMILFIVQGNKK